MNLFCWPPSVDICNILPGFLWQPLLRTLSAPWVNKLQFYIFFFQCGYILSHWRGLIMHDSSLFYWVSSRVNSFNWCRTAQRRDYNGTGEFPLLLRMVCSLFSYFPIFYCITPRISIYLFLNLRPGSPGFISLLVSPGLPCQLTTPICILVLYYILAK